jgi:transglutaminase-like putative cysteine protease
MPARQTSAGSTAASAVERYFQAALYLMIVSGFGTLAVTGQLDWFSLLFVTLALAVRGYLLLRRAQFVLAERWTSLLTLGYVLFYLTDFALISHSFLTATVHLVMFGMVVKIFSSQRTRDHLMLAILSFAMVLAAAVLTVDSSFLFAFSIFMLTAVTTFVLLEMKASSAAASTLARDSADSATQKQLSWSLAGAGPMLLVLILSGGAAIFFVLPRVAAGYLGNYSPSHEIATGFSENVRLGRIGEIQQSSSVVMHVEIDGDTRGAHDLRWRGVALSLFDGKAWSNPGEQLVVPRLPDGRYVLNQRDPRWQVLAAQTLPGDTLHYRVLQEPLGTNLFFLADRPALLRGAYQLITTDSGGAVFNADRDHPIGVYEGWSNVRRTPDEQLRRASGPVPPSIALAYLQLPKMDARIGELAQQVAAHAGNDYDRARALELYLQRNFGYTLQLPPSAPRDPIAEFLFVRKQGHCEYFASSMAIMLRLLHIPARVVNGFRGGQFNDLTAQYVLRARDAHSWVEAYFPGEGWISFDPTPPSSALLTTSNWGRVQLYLDALASFWREWVINYDSSHQHALGEDLAAKSRSLLHNLRRALTAAYARMLKSARSARHGLASAPRRWAGGAAGLVALLLLAAAFPALWRWWRNLTIATHPARAPRRAATIWYARVLRRLARRGMAKPVTQTPQEFLQQITDPDIQAHLGRFLSHYERARFGESEEDAEKLPALYEEIVGSLRK